MEETDRLWPGTWAARRHGSKMMQADLKAARTEWLDEADTAAERGRRERSDFLEYRDGDGRQADFHALRHTFLSRLGRSGASPKVMQRLARHTTVELTLGRYTHANVYDLVSAVEAMPSLPTGPNAPQADAAVLRATGTDAVDSAPQNVLPFCLPDRAANESTSVHPSTADTMTPS